MRNSLKRILSLALSLVLVLSLVPATVFAAETETVSDCVAVNTSTGVTYTSVSEACDEAEAGQTIQLTSNFTDDTVVIDEEITLDLAGYNLTADYVASYGDIIDSSEGTTGLLTVPANHLMLETDNTQLPVRDGEGYRFVEIIGYNTAMVNENKYAFQPLFEADAHRYLAAGAEATGVSIQVDVSWTQDGTDLHVQFAYTDELVNGYINSYNAETGKYGKMFTLTKQSTGYYENLGFEAIVISDSDVRIGAGATYPEGKVDGKVEVDSENKLVNDVTVYNNQGSATIQAGTQLEDATGELKLTASQMDSTGTDITLSNGEQLQSFDVHVSGVSKDNTVPVIITLNELAPEFLNRGNLDLYHVENGVTVPMTRVYVQEEVDVHNEYYYDIATGTVTLAMATFSEVATVSDTEKAWQGEVDHTWYEADATELYIANADQLWSFSQIVGGMAEGIAQDSFSGKKVTLLADLNLADDEANNVANKIFYPVGYYNSDGTYEKTNTAITSSFKTFQGTFDGAGHTISNIYQNTWEMKGDHDWYDAKLQYYRDGMGLFGKVYGGTVKNLTVKNFSSDGEITTTGVIAAYADCGATFENIAIFNCNPRVYNIGNGGIVGCVGWYANDTQMNNTVTFKNITVDNTNKISALWGSYDVACGGIVGQYYPTSGQTNAIDNAGIHFENCHVAAQMDVYNDVCANYQYYAYRYTGMMIGSIRENVTIDGHVYPKMDGITASGCTVHFGDWNDYYYCELVANTTASYTHDHQMSRLEQVAKVEGTTITYLDGTTGTVPASGRYNYVVVLNKDEDGKWIHGDGHDYATCYHFVNGVQHFHDVADNDNPEIWETVNGEKVLKEDKQLIYREFNQLFTGYGWGVTSKGILDFEGIENMDITHSNNKKAVVKFTGLKNNATYNTGAQVTVGELFEAFSGAGVDIDTDNVQVFVAPADDNSLAGGTYVADKENWTQGTVTFTGHGLAQITINDYFYCEPTTITVTINPTMKLEVVSHDANAYTENGDTAQTQVTKVYVYASADSDLTLADSTITVPSSWTDKQGNALNSTWTGGDKVSIGTEKTLLAEFLAPADTAVENASLTYDMKVWGADKAVVAESKTQVKDNVHAGEWTAWTSTTSLPSEPGKYYLTDDVHLVNQSKLVNKTVVLCLNSKTIYCDVDRSTNSDYRDRAFGVQYGANLTVCDCTAHTDTNGTYTAGKITGASQGALMIPHINPQDPNAPAPHSSSVINLYDGILTGNVMQTDSATLLAQDGGTVNIYGGLITENYNIKGGGAGVFCGGDSTLNVYDGEISKNAAMKGAGIWCPAGTVTICRGVKILNNRTWQDITDRHGLLEGQTADDGVTQYDSATIGKAETVTDIDGNEYSASFVYDPANNTYGAGAGIYVAYSTLNITGAQISGNKAWLRGGAIYAYDTVLNITDTDFDENYALTYKSAWYSTTSTDSNQNSTNSVQPTADGESTESGDTNTGSDNSGGEGNTDMGEGGTSESGYWQIRSSTGAGGAIFMNQVPQALIDNCRFTKNDAASNGGAIDVTSKSNATLKDVIMTGNANHAAGAAALYVAGEANCVVDGGEITGNYGDANSGVAGVYIPNNYSTLTLTGSPIITGNGRKYSGVTTEYNIYLQNNNGRISSAYGEAIPDAILRVRDLEPGTCLTVHSARGASLDSDLSKWLDWKNPEEPTAEELAAGVVAFDKANEATYYGTWDQTYIRNSHANLKDYVILADTAKYELYLTDDHGLRHSDSNVWYAWGDDTVEEGILPTVTGYYYLTDNVTLAEAQSISGDANVTLCLNGYSVTAAGERIYDVSGTATLTICDCAVAVSDTETVTSLGTLYTGTGEGGAIYAESGTTVNLENIKVTGKRADDTQVEEIVNGGAIYATSATVNMTNVLFTNVRVKGETTLSKVHKGRGGVIFADGATKLNLTNVTIDDCSGGMGAALHFAGTANQATLSMTDVTIENCMSDAAMTEGDDISSVPTDPAYSEIVHLNGVKADLNNCKIQNNTCYDSLRGPVYLSGSTVATMTGCTITGNAILRSTQLGYESYGVIYMTHPAKLVLNGTDNEISGNYLYKYDAQSDARETQREVHIFLQQKSSSLTTQFPTLAFQNITNSNYTARFNASEKFDDLFESDVTENNVTVPAGTENWNRWLKAENCTAFGVLQEQSATATVNTTYRYDLEGNTFIKCDGTHPNGTTYHAADNCGDGEWIAWTSTDSVPATAGFYYLTQDITVTERKDISTNQNIIICLNGHTISYEEPATDNGNYNGILYYMKNAEINLTICDCSANGDITKDAYSDENPYGYKAGTITGFTDSVLFTPDSGVNSNITINIRDIIVKDNKNDGRDVTEGSNSSGSSVSGGVIVAQGGVNVNISGALFTGNSASGAAGVIYASNSKVSISKAAFLGNTADAGEGAVIRLSGTDGALTMSESTFANNTAATYGGVINVTSSAVTATKCTFANNTATTSGGVIYATNSAAVTATDCIFTENKAQDGGAIYPTNSASLNATGCTFKDNTATYYGGAICATGGTAASDKEFTVSGCTFTNNTASYGGAIYMKYRGNASVTDCTFTENKVTTFTSDTSTKGGIGGAICMDSSTVTISGGSFSGNTAAVNGGAILVYNAAATVTGSCEITGNSATVNGGGIFAEGSSSGLTLDAGVTVTDNTAATGKDVCLDSTVTNYADNGATITDKYPVPTT